MTMGLITPIDVFWDVTIREDGRADEDFSTTVEAEARDDAIMMAAIEYAILYPVTAQQALRGMAELEVVKATRQF